jgi:hypothetical protein
MIRDEINRVRVLFLAANPADKQVLHLQREIREVQTKIRASEHRDSLELIDHWAVRPDDLLQALLEIKPHIVHLSGHGGRVEGFYLQDQDGLSQPVDKETLLQLFRTLKNQIRVALFNACSTERLAEAIVQVIDCAIGMNQPIDDDAAIIFAGSFYRAIGFGESVQAAFDLGKLALKLENIPDAKTPKLFVREGVDASKIMLVPTRSMDRASLVKTLCALSPSDFASFVASIENAASHISRHGTVREHALELIEWAESAAGPGLARIHEAWVDFQ